MWCNNMLIMSLLSQLLILSNKKRRLWTTTWLFAVLISQTGMCGEKRWWWTLNIRGLLVMISCVRCASWRKITIFSQCEILHIRLLWLIIWSLQHRKQWKQSSESQTEIFRQLARRFRCGNFLLWRESSAKLHGDASKCKTKLLLCKCSMLQGELSRAL